VNRYCLCFYFGIPSLYSSTFVIKQLELTGARIGRTIENLKKLGRANITKCTALRHWKKLDSISRTTWTNPWRLQSKRISITVLYGKSLLQDRGDLMQKTKLLKYKDAYMPQSARCCKSCAVGCAPTAISVLHKCIYFFRWLFTMDALSIFQTPIIDNSTLNKVEKLHYLKSSTTESTSQLLHNTAITGDKFDRAWALLKNRYEHLLVNAYAMHRCAFDCQ